MDRIAVQIREIGVVEATEGRSAYRSWKLELEIPKYTVSPTPFWDLVETRVLSAHLN